MALQALPTSALPSRGRLARCAPVLAALGLAACSSEPSGGDLEKALRIKFDAAARTAAAVAGPQLAKDVAALTPQLHGLTKKSCQATKDSKVWNCSVEVDMSSPIGGRQKQVMPMTVVKTVDGWRLPG